MKLANFIDILIFYIYILDNKAYKRRVKERDVYIKI